PRSTLFPYTTLFRSHVASAWIERIIDAAQGVGNVGGECGRFARFTVLRAKFFRLVTQHQRGFVVAIRIDARRTDGCAIALQTLRSEEHTSELQSREN